MTQRGQSVDGGDALLDSLQIPYEGTLTPSLPDNFVLTVQGMDVPVTFLRDDQAKVVGR